jgi:hypothetical protein
MVLYGASWCFMVLCGALQCFAMLWLCGVVPFFLPSAIKELNTSPLLD